MASIFLPGRPAHLKLAALLLLLIVEYEGLLLAIQASAPRSSETIVSAGKSDPKGGIDWAETAEIWSNLATVIGLFVGGLWAYLKFFKGRTFYPRLELKVSGRPGTIHGSRTLVARLEIKNVGLSRVQLSQEYCRLEVSFFLKEAYELIYEKVASSEMSEIPRAPVWSEPGIFRAFNDHLWVESGEAIVEEMLVTVPPDPHIAYSLTLRVVSPELAWVRLVRKIKSTWLRKRPTTWTTVAIVEQDDQRRKGKDASTR